MNIEIGADGKVRLHAPQQRWSAPDDDKGVLETANFAGHQMMAMTDDHGAFNLRYLGFVAGGFQTIEDAKKAGPEFARRVLNRMISMIAD